MATAHRAASKNPAPQQAEAPQQNEAPQSVEALDALVHSRLIAIKRELRTLFAIAPEKVADKALEYYGSIGEAAASYAPAEAPKQQ